MMKYHFTYSIPIEKKFFYYNINRKSSNFKRGRQPSASLFQQCPAEDQKKFQVALDEHR